MYPAADNLLNNLVLLSANAVKLLEGFFSNLGEGDHSRSVEGEGLLGNCRHLGVELGFWGRALFGSFALDLGNLDGGFDMLRFVFDMQGKALDNLAIH